jgi:hypothetical protein
MALKDFDPHSFLRSWAENPQTPSHTGKTFEQCMRDSFAIPNPDKYVYMAHAQITLADCQKAINGKRANTLHQWYHQEDGKPVGTSSVMTSRGIIDIGFRGLTPPSRLIPIIRYRKT